MISALNDSTLNVAVGLALATLFFHRGFSILTFSFVSLTLLVPQSYVALYRRKKYKNIANNFRIHY